MQILRKNEDRIPKNFLKMKNKRETLTWKTKTKMGATRQERVPCRTKNTGGN
jgi:hypothetical protein